jgi:hypothetical protein
MAFDPIPQARVVRKAGQLMTPPRAPRTEDAGSVIVRHLRNGFAIAMGMWPLTAVLLLMLGLLVMAGNSSGTPYH